MQNETPAQVPYIAFESAQARSERMAHRLIVALVLAVIMLFASNAAWLYVWQQYDYCGETTTTTYQQDGEGLNIIGDNNHVAEENSDSEAQDENAQRWLQGNAKAQVG